VCDRVEEGVRVVVKVLVADLVRVRVCVGDGVRDMATVLVRDLVGVRVRV